MKEEILHKAAHMFLTLGFKSVTMDDIANEMGISKKTIYQHFSNKNELVEATTEHLFDVISTGIDCICSMGKNAIEELFEIKEFAMKQLKDESSSPFHQLHKYFTKVSEDLKRQQFEKMYTCVCSNLKKGVESGLYREDLDFDFTARIYFIGVSGIRDHDVFPTANYSMRSLEEKYLDYHLRAIVSAKGLQVLESIIQQKNRQ